MTILTSNSHGTDNNKGCVYLVSSWYKRYEVQKRMAGFFLTASALSAFANILAYGLIQISKTHHYKG